MFHKILKRIIDILFSILFICFFFPLIIIIYFIVKLTSRGPFIHWSKRVGKNEIIFFMPKIRTMQVSTPQLATHLLKNPDLYLTSVGSFLRKTSIDELPQIWSILIGDMSLVGPRPALFNQHDLIKYRRKVGVHKLIPGLTGWAQINGRDNLKLKEKVNLDLYYLRRCSIFLDIKIILFSSFMFLYKKNIKH
jgi:O-antigen biosynthesis protein WbqP